MKRLRIGTFIKTPAPQIVEVLGLSGLDFAVLDAEHAPLDRATLDLMLLAGRAATLSLLVRVPDDRAVTLLHALDCGADGLIIPHVDTPEQAAAIVNRARFAGGERGFSNSPRFSRYGTTGIEEAMTLGDRAEIICQIESRQAVEQAAEIANVPGVAGLLVGRADLALSLGHVTLDHPDVVQATERTVRAAVDAGKFAGVVVGSSEEMPAFIAQGVSVLVVASDQSLLRAAARSNAERGRAAATASASAT